MSAERARAIRLRRTGRFALVCLCTFLAEDAPAQPAPPAKAQVKSSLRSRLGVEAAAPLLRSESMELRLRGFEKLGATGTSAALELLADALEAGGAARTANE